MEAETLEFKTSHISHSGAHTDRLRDQKRSIFDFKIDVTNKHSNNIGKEKFLNFEMVGLDPAVAILIRRSINNDVKTVAIEKVGIYLNTSLIPDENLAHRLGLVPIDADAEKLEVFKRHMTPKNTLVFKLEVSCRAKEGASEAELALLPKEEKWENSTVYSKDLKWVPQTGQKEIFEGKDVKCLYDNIVIAKLRPGQAIALEAFCQLGTAIDHAKFSAAASAFFKLKPDITINRPIKGKRAEKYCRSCPEGLFGIDKKGKLIVKDAGKCVYSREVLRLEEDEGKEGEEAEISFRSKKGHYLFEIESNGVIEPSDLILRAMREVRSKCSAFLENLDELND